MIGGGGYGPPRRESEGTRLAPLMNGVCAVVVAGSEPATAVAVAVGAARVQCATRRVAVADLVGDAPLILRLLPDDDPHGISDSFLYGVSFNKIARPVEGEDQLYLIPSGTEGVTTAAIYGSERWRRLAAGFHQVGALLIVVARPEVPGFDALCTHVGAVLPVGELPVPVPPGVTELRAAPEQPMAATPQPPSPWEALLAETGASSGPAASPLGAVSRGLGAAGIPSTADAEEETARDPRQGLRVDAGLVRPKTEALVGDEAAMVDRKPRWWRSSRAAMVVALVLAGVTVGVVFPDWLDPVTAPFASIRSLFAGAPTRADSTGEQPPRETVAPAPAPAAPAETSTPSVVATDSVKATLVAAEPPATQVAPAPTPRVEAPTLPAPPTVPLPPTQARPAPAPPTPAPAAAASPAPAAVSAQPPRSAMAVANPQEAAQAARYALYVATSNTREGALPDPRLRDIGTLALTPVTDAGARWYRLTVGAEASAGDAVALLGRLRAKDPTISGSVVALPYALQVERGVPAGQVAGRLAALAGRGVFAYALRQADGSGVIYTGAFESPDQARTLADSLRAVGMAPTLVYRTGRAF